MKYLGFIPARGGSKGIINKNLSPLAGKPLIQYTLEAAQKANKLDLVFLSSDSSEIISFCSQRGLKDSSYVRPAHLATDTASTLDTVFHGVSWVEEKYKTKVENVVLLQPTNPLRGEGDIDSAIQLYESRKTSSLMSVSEMIEHPYECVSTKDNAWSYLKTPPATATRRQDFEATKEKFFFINGSIYICSMDFLRQEKTFVVESKTVLFEISKRAGLDINDSFDLALAEGAVLRK